MPARPCDQFGICPPGPSQEPLGDERPVEPGSAPPPAPPSARRSRAGAARRLRARRAGAPRAHRAPRSPSRGSRRCSGRPARPGGPRNGAGQPSSSASSAEPGDREVGAGCVEGDQDADRADQAVEVVAVGLLGDPAHQRRGDALAQSRLVGGQVPRQPDLRHHVRETADRPSASRRGTRPAPSARGAPAARGPSSSERTWVDHPGPGALGEVAVGVGGRSHGADPGTSRRTSRADARQERSSALASGGTSTAYSRRTESGTTSSARTFVEARTTGGATPSR